MSGKFAKSLMPLQLVVVEERPFQLIVGDALTRNPSNVDTISAASASLGFARVLLALKEFAWI